MNQTDDCGDCEFVTSLEVINISGKSQTLNNHWKGVVATHEGPRLFLMLD